MPYDPAIQKVTYRQISAQRPGGEEEYEPLQAAIVTLKKEKPSKANASKIGALTTQISNIKAKHGNNWLTTFVIVDGCIVDVELLDENNIDAVAVDCYWRSRDGSDPLGNFELFIGLLSDDTINELYFQGYEQTRAKLPPAPEETQGDSPPKDNPLEQNGSPVNEGKHTKKRIENAS